MDAATLIGTLHGTLIRTIAEHTGVHYEGLQKAGRKLNKNGQLSAKTARQIQNLDVAFNIMRHVTCVSCDKLLAAVKTELVRHDDAAVTSMNGDTESVVKEDAIPSDLKPNDTKPDNTHMSGDMENIVNKDAMPIHCKPRDTKKKLDYSKWNNLSDSDDDRSQPPKKPRLSNAADDDLDSASDNDTHNAMYEDIFDKFDLNDTVLLHGLLSKAGQTLNGKMGTIVGLSDNARLELKLQDSGKIVCIKVENCKRATSSGI